MFKHLIHKEIMHSIKNYRVLLVYISMGLLLAIGVINGHLAFINKYRSCADNAAAFRDKAAKASTLMGAFTFQVNAAPRPLSVLAAGVTDDLIQPFTIEPLNRGGGGGKSFVNPLYFAHNRFDFSFIVMAVLSLMAVFICFDSVSSEDNTRILRQLLANSISKREYILSKMAGGVLVTVLPFTVYFVLVQGYLAFDPFIPFTAEIFIRTVGMYILSCLYLSLFCLMSILCSVLFKQPVVSFALCIIGWFSLVFLVPGISAEAAGIFSPVWSVRGFEEAVVRIRQEGYNELKMQGQGAGAEEYKRLSIKISDKVAHGISRLEREREEQIRRQERTGHYFMNVSPGALFSVSMATLCGTGIGDYYQFLQWRKDVRRAHTTAFGQECERRIERGDVKGWNDGGVPAEMIPSYRFPDNPSVRAFGQTVPAMLAFAGGCVLMAAFACICFLRYRIK